MIVMMMMISGGSRVEPPLGSIEGICRHPPVLTVSMMIMLVMLVAISFAKYLIFAISYQRYPGGTILLSTTRTVESVEWRSDDLAAL